MSVTVIATTALNVLKPVALVMGRSALTAVGYGTFAVAGYVTIRLGTLAIDTLADRIDPSASEQARKALVRARDAERSKAFLEMEIIRLRQAAGFVPPPGFEANLDQAAHAAA